MRGALLPSGPGSLLIDPEQLIALMQRSFGMGNPDESHGRAPAFRQKGTAPLTAQNYIFNPQRLSDAMRNRVTDVASRIQPNLPEVGYTGPGASAHNALTSGATRGLDIPPTNLTRTPALLASSPRPDLSRMPPINATVDPINPFDPANLSVIQAMAGQAQPQATPAPAVPAQPATPLETAPATAGNPAALIQALDPSFGQEPQAPPVSTLTGAPQLPAIPPPNLMPLPTMFHPGSGPVISAPNPAPAGPGGPVANLRFPVGHTPAISMMAPESRPMTAMGGPTPAETVPPAILQPAHPTNMIGAGFRRPVSPPPASAMPMNAPIDSSLAGLEANSRFMNGPGPGTSLEYPPPNLPEAPSPAPPATVAPSPPKTTPQTGAAMPTGFEDNLIKAALLLSAKRKAMEAGAHG